MAFASAASVRPAIADINVTPLVDVMLVLLIIFMVTTPLLDQRFVMPLPQSRITPPAPPTQLRLQVEPGDVLRLEGQAYAPAALQAELARRQAQEPGLVLKLVVDPQADYQGATTALAAAERAGVANISIE
ncbi:MAG: hypothetical protein ABS41_03185 [Arenimonas sp. SCN 70-307]|uniref:ExbD/TolR family protein n=1 Tax=Arenimonas sp. SCN 70-307 TaxID=1660089 RepID=UPI00086A4717|nr:biopolymer transporter ExbD [Arenimonas sp. SCN 70-307]ODS64280.1 MAG: hypothetical protein ABS41_03185 [Arenimonas sp. SCN 70-307]